MTQPQRILDLTMSYLIYEEEVNSTTDVIKIKILNVAHLRTRIRPTVPTVTRIMLYNLWAEIKSYLHVLLNPHMYNS